MSARPALKIVLAPAFDVFEARCQACASLCIEGELDLHGAVDELQASAVETGLVDEIGQDGVQRLMAIYFAEVPRPGDVEHCVQELIEIIETMPRPRPDVAASTIAAARYVMQQGDPEGLDAWLSARSAQECAAIFEALKRL